MNKEKTHLEAIEESYDPDKLTDLHSPKTDPSSYARNIPDDAKSVISKAGAPNTTERIPASIKFSDPNINKNDDEMDYEGQL